MGCLAAQEHLGDLILSRHKFPRTSVRDLYLTKAEFILLGFCFFTFYLSRSAHLYTKKFGMCDLRCFCKNKTLASIGKCNPTRYTRLVSLPACWEQISQSLFKNKLLSSLCAEPLGLCAQSERSATG